MSSQSFVLLAIFAPYTLTGGLIDPQTLFTTMALTNLMIILLQNAVFSIFSAIQIVVGFKRLQAS